MQTCSCISEQACDAVYDGDPWDEWDNAKHPIDKGRKCCECDELIKKGELCEYTRGWMWERDDEGFEVETEDGDYVEAEKSVCAGDWLGVS